MPLYISLRRCVIYNNNNNQIQKKEVRQLKQDRKKDAIEPLFINPFKMIPRYSNGNGIVVVHISHNI